MGKNSGGVRGRKDSLGEKLSIAERGIKNKEKETAILFDSKGKEILRNEGGYDYVKFSESDMKKMKDGILTHNHPSGQVYEEGSRALNLGTSFSRQDIDTAINGDVREIRAVTRYGYTYSLKRPSKGWGVSKAEFDAKYETIKKAARKKTTEYLNRTGWEQRNIDRANLIINHDINRMLAKEFGWIYTRMKK